MKYDIRLYNLHIEDSYQASKKDFRPFLETTRTNHPWSEIWNRSIGSMCREWAANNLLYAPHIFRSHTKDVDLNYPQKWYVSLAYNVFGAIAMIFIK